MFAKPVDRRLRVREIGQMRFDIQQSGEILLDGIDLREVLCLVASAGKCMLYSLFRDTSQLKVKCSEKLAHSLDRINHILTVQNVGTEFLIPMTVVVAGIDPTLRNPSVGPKNQRTDRRG